VGGPWVAVAHALGPSDAIDLARHGVAGIATDVGGRTSHTAILAQALGVPAVAGLREISRAARPGDPIVVDGDRGEVILGPHPATEEEAIARRAEWVDRETRAAVGPAPGPARTSDGLSVLLRANVEFPEETNAARRFGAQGVGLYRSEFLFLARAPALPTEDEHCDTYRALARSVAPDPVVVRTLDLGGEKYFHDVLDRGQSNPVLGLRAVRLCLRRPDVFRPQIRGLLRASVEPNLRVMLPFVTAVDEIREVRRMWHEEAERLRGAGLAVRESTPIGVMIEVPAAAIAADVLAREADFLSVGTNDLIQYALAVDRGNETVDYLYRPDHPGVLRLVRCVVEAAEPRGRPVAVCGEMASDPACLPLLLGLGVRELSVPPRSILRVRDALAATDSRDARRAVEALLG
jgi:phosphotransferase system enzyme I (PtsI)